MMRRVVRVWALAALVSAITAVMAVPAMAIDFDFDDNNIHINDLHDIFDNNNDGDFFDSDLEQESESGDIETNFSVENTGDYASQCTPAIQFGNSGNFNNGSSLVQGFSELDDFEPGGIEFGFEPEQDVSCENTIQQSSAASS